jgi:mono/diheme cytochrome c family protein
MVRAIALACVGLSVVLGARLAARAQDRTTWDGVYTEEQANRGEALYKDHCSRCHGVTLQGNGEGALPLTGATFGATWNGVTLGAMMERVRLSMPQDKPATMSRQQIADLLAFILRSNKYPAGQTELAKQTDILNAITFKVEKLKSQW